MCTDDFEAVTRADEARDAYEALLWQVTTGAERLRHAVGHRGGHEKVAIYWRPDEQRLWVQLQVLENRYWCRYGLEDPRREHRHLLIACEANPPRVGKNWKCAGAFARDARGALYYLHSGRIGGGCPGVGMAKFLDIYTGPRVQVGWPDGTQRSMLMLGGLEDPALLASISQFAQQVDEFKCVKNPRMARRRSRCCWISASDRFLALDGKALSR